MHPALPMDMHRHSCALGPEHEKSWELGCNDRAHLSLVYWFHILSYDWIGNLSAAAGYDKTHRNVMGRWRSLGNTLHLLGHPYRNSPIRRLQVFEKVLWRTGW